MSAAKVCGFDGGVDTGFGVWGQGGIILHVQGPMDQVMADAVRYMRVNADDVVCAVVERAFITRDVEKIGGSVRAVENEAWIRAVLWTAGFPRDLVWRAEASEWRAAVGIDLYVPLHSHSAKRRRATGDEMKAAAVERYRKHLGLAQVPKSQQHVAEACCMAEAGYRRWHGRQMVSSGQLRER